MKTMYLKWKLKKLYLKINYDFQEYNCGHKMLLTISSNYYDLCEKFNRLADRLSKLDDACPKFRYDLKTK